MAAENRRGLRQPAMQQSGARARLERGEAVTAEPPGPSGTSAAWAAPVTGSSSMPWNAANTRLAMSCSSPGAVTLTIRSIVRSLAKSGSHGAHRGFVGQQHDRIAVAAAAEKGLAADPERLVQARQLAWLDRTGGQLELEQILVARHRQYARASVANRTRLRSSARARKPASHGRTNRPRPSA